MSSVFVLGASGFIGNAVAKEFQRKGYRVFGLTRSEDKAKQLRHQEIVPVLGKAQDTAAWEKTALQVDIIVEAISDLQDYSTGVIVQKALLNILKSHPEKVVIYTSGVWLYGNTTRPVDENTPFDQIHTPDLVKSRIEVEKNYREAKAIVVRPANVYGHGASLTGTVFFKNLKEGKGEFPGSPSNEPHWSYVHVDDLADAYVRVADRANSLKGQVIDLVSHTENVRELLQGVAKVAGYKGEIKFKEPQDPFSVCLGLSQKHLYASKARTVLGWNPVQLPITADPEKYYKSWEASN